MVNVAGRSKGCSTCRKRRVKCDESRPICQRCQKSGLVCDGPKGTAFIEARIVKSKESQIDLTKTSKKRKQASAFLDYQRPMTTHGIVPEFNKHERYICYTRSHLLPNGPIDLRLQELQITDIVPSPSKPKVADMPVFNQAFLSFATIFFGTAYHQPHILAQGYAIHGAALQKLNQTLRTPECHVQDDVVISVTILAMLESMLPSGPNNHLKHMLGLERLLGLRSPASLLDCSYRTLEMYKGVRHMILFASLRNRSPSILARPEWKAVLRTGLSLEEPEEQDLHDVLADCSVLIAASDAIAADRDGWTIQQRNDMEYKAKELLLYLKTWKQRWDDDVRNIRFEEQQPRASNVPHVPTIYRFGSASIARMFMLYNTALVYVLEVLASLTFPSIGKYVSGTASQTDVWASVAVEDYDTARRLASLEIARCVTDYLHHLRVTENSQFVSLVVQWAFVTALKALGGGQSVEGEWMMGLLHSVGSHAFAKGAWE